MISSVRDLKIRPVVELGFMPEALASGTQTIFWWKGNVTHAASRMSSGANSLNSSRRHFTERYGADEVRKWYFEVWNEPNLDGFWPARASGVFQALRIQRSCDQARRSALSRRWPCDGRLRMDQGDTRLLRENDVPIDFIATHAYGAMEGFLDEHGRGKTMLAPSPASVVDGLPDVLAAIRSSKWPNLPVQVTEWGPSYSPCDPVARFLFLRRLDPAPAPQLPREWRRCHTGHFPTNSRKRELLTSRSMAASAC